MINIEYFYELWGERAAIKEFDAKESRFLSEKRAFFDVAHLFCYKKKIGTNSEEAQSFKRELKEHIQNRRLPVYELNLVGKK